MDIEYNNNNKEEFKAKENSGLYFKDRGNEEFEKGNYEAAITNYSKAIVQKIIMNFLNVIFFY